MEAPEVTFVVDNNKWKAPEREFLLFLLLLCFYFALPRFLSDEKEVETTEREGRQMIMLFIYADALAHYLSPLSPALTPLLPHSLCRCVDPHVYS